MVGRWKFGLFSGAILVSTLGYMGVSLNVGTPHPKWLFLVGLLLKAMVVGNQHFRKSPYGPLWESLTLRKDFSTLNVGSGGTPALLDLLTGVELSGPERHLEWFLTARVTNFRGATWGLLVI